VLKADDFVPRDRTPLASGRRITPLGVDPLDDAPAAKTKPFAAAIAAVEASTDQGANMPRGVYDRSKSKPRVTKPKADAPGEQGTEKPSKKRGRRKIAAVKPRPARQAKPSALGSRRFGRWDDGSIDINLPCCSGHLSAEEGKELQAFLAGARGSK
jgi:hypothetical protein